ncbi:MAG: hypothetical protein PVG23_07630 [Nitrosopumilaceae archaeon]
MAQICRGLCERLRAPSKPNNSRYSIGQKRCSLCASFFDIDGVMCPCCKTRLRSKARKKNRNG